MGHTVNFRTKKLSYKDKNSVHNSPEDWIIFENTQEAIVDEETRITVQNFISDRIIIWRLRCTGFFCLAIIKGPPNDIYCIIEEPSKHYFTEKVSYSHFY